MVFGELFRSEGGRHDAQVYVLCAANTELNVMNHHLFGAFRCGAMTDLILDGTPLHTFGLSPTSRRQLVQELEGIVWATESDQLAAMAERKQGVRVSPLRRGS